MSRQPRHWYVTAAHVVPLMGREVPYGTQHARHPGEPLAACGRFVLDWPILWDRPFDHPAGDVCSDCAEVVKRFEQPVLTLAGGVCEDCAGAEPSTEWFASDRGLVQLRGGMVPPA